MKHGGKRDGVSELWGSGTDSSRVVGWVKPIKTQWNHRGKWMELLPTRVFPGDIRSFLAPTTEAIISVSLWLLNIKWLKNIRFLDSSCVEIALCNTSIIYKDCCTIVKLSFLQVSQCSSQSKCNFNMYNQNQLVTVNYWCKQQFVTACDMNTRKLLDQLDSTSSDSLTNWLHDQLNS